MSFKKFSSHHKLHLLQVFFRHGNRTPLAEITYPNNPHENHNFYPYGHGNLTKDGKLNAFKLGKELRNLYGDFLGDCYFPEDVKAISSSRSRCQTTLLVALAGLFPPNEQEKFQENLKWQPIPYSVPLDEDLIFFKLGNPDFLKLYPKISEDEFLNKYEDTILYLGENSGLCIKNLKTVFELYNLFEVQEELGLTLPNWTHKIYPEPMKEISIAFFNNLNRHQEMTNILIGLLLDRITQEMHTKICGDDTKIFLYCGHDVNIWNLLFNFGFKTPDFPSYCSYVIFELLSMEDSFYVKMWYKDFLAGKKSVVRLNDKVYCPIDEFFEFCRLFSSIKH